MTETPAIRRIVKQVLSGDSIIIRDKPRGAAPEEIQVGLSWIIAPKMGRKSGNKEEIPEDIGAFEAREFLRKRLVGKEIIFKKLYSVPIGPGGSRDCGLIYLDNDEQSINEKLIDEGLAEVIKRRQNEESPIYKRMIELEEAAKEGKKGKWAPVGEKKSFKRRIVHQELSQDTAESLKNKTFKENAIVEYIQSADQMRISLLVNKEKHEWQMITLRLSGIKCRNDSQLAEESKFFVESRILQRDVLVKIESLQRTGDNPILFGSVFGGRDNANNIAIALLKEGYGTIIDVTLKLTPDPAQYRAAVADAKARKVRIWKDYKGGVDGKSGGAGENGVEGAGKTSFDGKVIEIINGDALNIISNKDGQVKKVFLASIRPPPRRADIAPDQKVRALYDTPYMFEAREFLRKKLIGKNVKVIVDYVQPKNENFPEKTCATVMLGGVNIGEALVSRGLASVVKYRADEERKASNYDVLLDSEIKAEKAKKGIHGKEAQGKKVVDLSFDVSKAKGFMPFLIKSGQGGPRKDGLVEHVFSASRIKVFIPKENCLINLIIGGINADKPNDSKYGQAGFELVKSLVHQRDIQCSIENMDKVGNYIGYVYYETEPGHWKNLSLTLIEKGLASIRDARDAEMIRAEEEAKKEKIGLWADWVPEEEEDDEDEDNEDNVSDDNVDETEDGETGEKEGNATTSSATGTTSTSPGGGTTEKTTENKNGVESKKKSKKEGQQEDYSKLDKVVPVEVNGDLTGFYAQHIKQGEKLEKLLDSMQEELKKNPPTPFSYNFKKGEIVSAKYSDGRWYRGKIEKLNVNAKTADIFFIDYGNSEVVSQENLAPLPSADYSINNFPAAAILYGLAFMTLPANDSEALADAKGAFETTILGKEFYLKKEYVETLNGNPIDMVSLIDVESKQNACVNLVKQGYFMVKNIRERRKDTKFNKILSEYKSAQEVAKKKRLVLWVYGDNTEDDAREFGLAK